MKPEFHLDNHDVTMYSGIVRAIGGGFTPVSPPNKSLQANQASNGLFERGSLAALANRLNLVVGRIICNETCL